MKIALVVLVFVSIAAGYVYINTPVPEATYRTVWIAENALRVKIAATPETHEMGLQGVTMLGEDEGMLFIFSEPAGQNFWNKNTLLDLDLIWIRDSQVIGVGFLPKIASDGDTVTISSPGAVNRVLEVSAGWSQEHGVKIGDRFAMPK